MLSNAGLRILYTHSGTRATPIKLVAVNLAEMADLR